MLLYAGLLMAMEDVIWPMRALFYVSPMHYALRAIVFEAFINITTVNGTSDCILEDPSPDNPFPSPFCNDRGFECVGRRGHSLPPKADGQPREHRLERARGQRCNVWVTRTCGCAKATAD